MAFDITSAVNRVQDIWLEISGIRAAPDDPPEKLDPFPIAVTFERFGHLDNKKMYSGTFAPLDGTLWSELHIQRVSLPLAIRTALTFRNTFLRKLMADPDLAEFMLLVQDIRWTLLPMEWGGIQTVGYRFELDYIAELAPA